MNVDPEFVKLTLAAVLGGLFTHFSKVAFFKSQKKERREDILREKLESLSDMALKMRHLINEYLIKLDSLDIYKNLRDVSFELTRSTSLYFPTIEGKAVDVALASAELSAFIIESADEMEVNEELRNELERLYLNCGESLTDLQTEIQNTMQNLVQN